jgi:hypothetical protein
MLALSKPPYLLLNVALEGLLSEVSGRDISFFFTLLQNELYRMENHLLLLRDKILSADPSGRRSFIILLNYISFPTSYDAFSPLSFGRFLDTLRAKGIKTRIVPIRPSPASTPLKRNKSSTVVNIAMLVRYGEKCLLIWAHPEVGSGLLGWHCQLPKELEAAQAKGPMPLSIHEEMCKLDLGSDSNAIKPDSVEYQTMNVLKSMRGIDAADFQSAMNQLWYAHNFGKEGVYGIVRP